MNISVIIPTYKNREQLIRNLQHNLTYLKGCEVIVVNDYPAESLKHQLIHFSNVTLIENAHNYGFGKAVNIGVRHAHNDILMFLNSDVLLHDDSYLQGLDRFKKNPSLFGIGFAQKEKDGSIVGKNYLYWQRGFFQHARSPDNLLGINGWAEGGACMLDRHKFDELQGFDELYNPFYWEDIDLSYRAWKKGYTVLFDPHILVEHHHESTIGKYFKPAFITHIAFRNQLIFTWKNINDRGMLVTHIISLKLMLAGQLLRGHFSYINGYMDAVTKIGHILSKRKEYAVSDKKILSQFYEA